MQPQPYTWKSYAVHARTDSFEEFRMEIVARTDAGAESAGKALCAALGLTLMFVEQMEDA